MFGTRCSSLTLVVLLFAAACSSTTQSTRTSPTTRAETSPSPSTVAVVRPPGPAADITGPVSGGKGMSLLARPDDALSAHGYHETEWVASGTAQSYRANGATGNDGRWSVSASQPGSPFRTRVLTFVPDAAKFNGTVIVEWMNVTSGFDLANDLAFLSPELERSGYAWVGVSAQKVGVDNLVSTDAARYGTLHHPGDVYAFDMFTQVGRAVRSGAFEPLRALQPRTVLAVGQSQSAWALTTYINAIQPIAGVFDGFFVHSRGGGAMRLDGVTAVDSFSTGRVRIRSDITVPVLVFETETDEEIGNYFNARQPDTGSVRLWDIAGAAHEDSYRVPSASVVGCTGSVNAAPTHYVAEAALHALTQWVQAGSPPAPAPRLAVSMVGGKPVVQRDARGIAIGGVRTAAIDVPVAASSGIGTDHSSVNCELIGSTKPFSAAQLRALYPSKAAYVDAFTKSTDDDVAAGYILPTDRAEIVANAQHVVI